MLRGVHEVLSTMQQCRDGFVLVFLTKPRVAVASPLDDPNISLALLGWGATRTPKLARWDKAILRLVCPD